MEKGKPFVLHAFHHSLADPLRVTGKEPGHKRRPIGEGHQRAVQGGIRVALGRSFGRESDRGTWRGLALGQTVNGIVKEKIVHIHISSRNMGQMATSDAQTVSVSAHSKDRQFRVRQFHARGYR